MQAQNTSLRELPLTELFFVLLWSSGFIAILWGLRYTNPFTFLFYRMLFAGVFMVLLAWFTKAPWPKRGRVLGIIILAGLLTQFLYLSSYFYALYVGVQATVLAIILALQPLLTAIIYSLILRRKVTRAQYLGLLLGFLGVVVTIGHDLSTQAMSPLGFALTLVTLVAITVGSVVQKYNPHMDLRSGNAIQFLVSVPPLFFMSLIFGSLKMPIAGPFILSLVWLVLGISVGGNYLYYKLLQKKCAVKVNSLFYLMPAVVAVFSYFVFGQVINGYIILGIVLIMIGVLATQKA